MSAEIEVLEPEIVGQQLQAVEKSAGLAEDNALALRGEFAPFYNSIVEWREKAAMVTKPDDATHQKIAREVRLGLRKVRCEVENVRKTLKADSLARGKAIDGFANVLKYLCEPVEEKLLAVEQHAERQEAARIAALVQERIAALAATDTDPIAYRLDQMDDETFALVLAAAKKRQAERIEAERKAEADRIAREKADADERERVRAENERLKKEAAAREAEAAKERARVDAERRKEREAAARAREAARVKAEADRIAAEKAAADAKIKADADARAKAERAPDKEKIFAFATAVEAVELPVVQTESGRQLLVQVKKMRDECARFIRKQAEAL